MEMAMILSMEMAEMTILLFSRNKLERQVIQTTPIKHEQTKLSAQWLLVDEKLQCQWIKS